MIEKIQHATASSPEGAKGLVKGVLACAFQNMAFMLPTGLLYLLVKDLLAGSTSGKTAFYLLGCAACFVLILLTTWMLMRTLKFIRGQQKKSIIISSGNYPNIDRKSVV